MYFARLKPGRINFKDSLQREKLMKMAEKSPHGLLVEIKPMTPESRDQRKFYHGAVLTLWAYLDGKDYKDPAVLDDQHEIAKLEFNPKVEVSNGKTYRIGQSSKGKLNQGFIEKIIDYLEENYAIDRTQVLDPKHYKDFRDRIYSSGEFDTYIDYLVSLRRLPGRQMKII
jgi:hypothetical protein